MVEVNYLINEVRKKKELSGLDDSVILISLEKQIRKGKFNLANLKKREIKNLVKLTRGELRIIAGSFNLTTTSRDINVDKAFKSDLLNLHISTRERVSSYPKLCEFIKNLKVKSILDLGCGLNPIALANADYDYYASDINKENINLIERFFKYNNFKGEAFIFDLRNIKMEKLPSTDLCLLLKVLDVVEKRGHKLAEEIVQSINSKYFLVSFSTKTLSGKSMNHPQRGWIEQMLSRLGYSYEIIKEKNEIFYFFEKTHPVNAL